MKKLFTLVIAVCSVGAVFAQSGSWSGRGQNTNHAEATQGGNSGSSYGQRGNGAATQGYNQGGAVNNSNYSNHNSSGNSNNNYGQRNSQWGGQSSSNYGRTDSRNNSYGRGDDRRDDRYGDRDGRDQRSRKMFAWKRFQQKKFRDRDWH